MLEVLRRSAGGPRVTPPLQGKCGIVAGVANESSIAFGCARMMKGQGAEVLCTYGHPKAEPHAREPLEALGIRDVAFCDVRDPEAVEAVFDRALERWGRLDFLVHSIAFGRRPDVQGRLTDSSTEAFLEAMDITCHSFVRFAKAAEPLMTEGGTLIAMSYLGAVRAVRDYALMGPVKAALESSVRYLASELGPAGIRVHAISPGPMPTRAASGLKDFDAMADAAAAKSPFGRLTTIDEVGALAAFLVSDGASGMTGSVHYVDAGVHAIESR